MLINSQNEHVCVFIEKLGFKIFFWKSLLKELKESLEKQRVKDLTFDQKTL